ncbi:MAG: hypothetical protein HRU34_03685 [Richelia sp.]|nr:hypothetical protein [Richelia sp.]
MIYRKPVLQASRIKKLLKQPRFFAAYIALPTLIIGYISNQLPALKDFLEGKNSQQIQQIIAGNRIAIAAFTIIGLIIT